MHGLLFCWVNLKPYSTLCSEVYMFNTLLPSLFAFFFFQKANKNLSYCADTETFESQSTSASFSLSGRIRDVPSRHSDRVSVQQAAHLLPWWQRHRSVVSWEPEYSERSRPLISSAASAGCVMDSGRAECLSVYTVKKKKKHPLCCTLA